MNSQPNESIRAFITWVFGKETAQNSSLKIPSMEDPWCTRVGSTNTPPADEDSVSPTRSLFSFCDCNAYWDDDFTVITTARREARRRLMTNFSRYRKHRFRKALESTFLGIRDLFSVSTCRLQTSRKKPQQRPAKRQARRHSC